MGYKNTLYVTGFNRDFRAKSLAPYFDKYGELIRVDIPPTKTPEGPPFAFVEFTDSKDCEAALDGLLKDPVILDEADRYVPPEGREGEFEKPKEAFGGPDGKEVFQVPDGALVVQLARSTPHPPRSVQRGYGGYRRGGYDRGGYDRGGRYERGGRYDRGGYGGGYERDGYRRPPPRDRYDDRPPRREYRGEYRSRFDDRRDVGRRDEGDRYRTGNSPRRDTYERERSPREARSPRDYED